MRKQEWTLIFFLAALKIALPFILSHAAFGLHRDEYLYYEQGQHLDFGFLENPALIGVLAKISSLAGGSFFWIKFWPAVFGAATLFLVAAIAKELGGGLYAILIAAMGMLFGAYMRIHFLFQPNFLEIFCWTLSAYFLLRFINTSQNKYLYFLCAALALGWWSKSSVLFFAVAIGFALLLSPQRKVVAQKHFWLAVLLGLALVLPNILWQATHNWPLLHHMKELRETQLQYVDPATFFKEQILFLLPAFFVWAGGVIWLLRTKKYRPLAITFLTCILLIALGSGKGYYTLGAYPMLLAAGGVWLERITAAKRAWRLAPPVLILALGIPLIYILLPLQPPQQMAESNKKWGLDELGILRWEDLENHPLQQDFADMIGWDELAQKAEKTYHALSPQEQKEAVVYCRSYGQAGALRYHAKDEAFRNKVICDNGTFLLWIPDTLQMKQLIFVGRDQPEKDDLVFNYFGKVQRIDSVTNVLSRQYGDKIILYRNATDSATILATIGIKGLKAVFGK